jgi:phage terminase large subunit GpA-like protein
MQNQRRYDIGTVPEQLSIADGNGKIVMLTCAADMNGKLDDGRLDYEVVAWSESGATYSVTHGSIGTFIPRESNLTHKVDRAHWSYANVPNNNIWTEFERILSTKFPVDDSSTQMQIFCTGLDCGYLDEYALDYIQRSRHSIFGVKGDRESKLLKFGVDVARFKQSLTSNSLYILQVGLYKDMLADYMQLFWDKNSAQPANFMNYPLSEKGKYGYEGFFQHYEAEHRTSVTQKDGSVNYRWVKKTETAQNHFFDCRIYNMAIAEIIAHIVCREHNIKKPTWADLVSVIQ